MDIKNYSLDELIELCEKIRSRILEVVSTNGGHLSSNIGAVELIVAMHFVFDAKKDPFIFDVSHQSYAHKLLSDRWDSFESLRKFGGISGYTKPSESEFDYFVAGHSSTSISLALGAAKAIKLKNEDRIPIAFIGDGAMSAGMAYEAMNELGDLRLPCIIVLNDNKMSISKPIGALSKYLSQAMAGEMYQKFKGKVTQILSHAPKGATYMAKKFENSLRLIMPGMFFEELGLEYIGPIDGHNLVEIINALEAAKAMKKPVVIHAQTIKGKGYEKAEGYEVSWHGVGPFDLQSGEFKKGESLKKATDIYSEALLNLAKKHENVVGVTAAMPNGTGIDKLMEAFPDRFWDTAIAEQHAVSSMAAMAKEGFKPYITIYSTFMQRAYDQVIHDLAIMNLGAVIAMDRAGIVGEDGETHQGAFDISFLNAIPNISMCAPRDERSFHALMEYSYAHKGVLALRYPRGSFILDEFKDKFANLEILDFTKACFLQENKNANVALIGYGNAVGKACKVALNLENEIPCDVVDLVFAKPLDSEFLLNLAKKDKIWYVFSDSAKKGGIAEILGGFLQDNKIYDIKIYSFEYSDKFIQHGNTSEVEANLGLDYNTITNFILNNKKS